VHRVLTRDLLAEEALVDLAVRRARSEHRLSSGQVQRAAALH